MASYNGNDGSNQPNRELFPFEMDGTEQPETPPPTPPTNGQQGNSTGRAVNLSNVQQGNNGGRAMNLSNVQQGNSAVNQNNVVQSRVGDVNVPNAEPNHVNRRLQYQQDFVTDNSRRRGNVPVYNDGGDDDDDDGEDYGAPYVVGRSLSVPFMKTDDLVVGARYSILSLRRVSGQFGQRIRVFTENFVYDLPQRFVEEMQFHNFETTDYTNVYFVYHGRINPRLK